MRSTTLLPLSLLAACGTSGDLPPYYPDRVDPSVSEIQPDSEPGNGGGAEVTITGNGFGTDPDEIVVRFGQRNAEIVSITDTELVVRTPAGPLTGGAVDVTIALPDGYVECWAPNNIVGYSTDCDLYYTYQTEAEEPEEGEEPFYADQRHYVVVQNLWTSCLGGMYTNPAIPGCETVAYFGETGLEGVAEFFRFDYPRLHTTHQEFVTGADANPLDWRVVEQFEPPAPSGIDDLKSTVGSFKLKNPLMEGEIYCADMAREPVDGEARTCTGIDIRRYDKGEVQFCEGEDPVTGGTRTYAPDWPVKEDFFQGEGGVFDAARILVDIHDETAEANPNLLDYPLTVPPPMVVRGDAGFADPVAWSVGGMADCPDGDGDGQATVEEDGVILSWEPIPSDLVAVEAVGDKPAIHWDELATEGDGKDLKGVNTWVHVSVSYLNVGWFSGDGWGLRASVTVPDDWQYDAETGRSSVGIPNSVLYQFPTPNSAWSSANEVLGTGHLGTFADEAAFMLIEIYRVSDYRLRLRPVDGQPTDTDDGELVFSYVTGDLSFTDWRNPAADGAACSNCLDEDGDGWTDFADPDCDPDTGTGSETTLTSASTCNDGLDNDGDLLIDSDDAKCTTGLDAESNCADGIDNDGDGWIDALDGECPSADPFAQEEGADDVAWTCSDGADTDGDGWVDADDPACARGDELEDDGFAGTPCNNDTDDDGDFMVDSEDLRCIALGAAGDSERPITASAACSDSADNDNDGFFDTRDPDCEFPPAVNEVRPSMSPTTFAGVPECYDGLDNDADGRTDADDPHCWNSTATFAPDGFLPSESVLRADQAATGCNDGLDGDADGWIDAKDPDCLPNAASQVEDGFGTTVCNDNVDNNNDQKIDSESSYCHDGFGTFEGP